MADFQLITSTKRYTGLSTDTKPATTLTGSLAKETDTGNEFIFNGVAWVAYSQPVSVVGSLANVQGSKNTVTAGTRVQLSADQACREVLIKAKRANTGYIYVGTVAVSSTAFGVDLAANESITLQVANLNQIYLDTSVSGEGVTFIAI